MKQLRQSDIHGAPLVFHAAASSELDFFKSVCEIVGKALGKSELRQQLQASSSASWVIYSSVIRQLLEYRMSSS